MQGICIERDSDSSKNYQGPPFVVVKSSYLAIIKTVIGYLYSREPSLSDFHLCNKNNQPAFFNFETFLVWR